MSFGSKYQAGLGYDRLANGGGRRTFRFSKVRLSAGSTRSAPVRLGHKRGIMRGAQLFSYTHLYKNFILFANMSLENFMVLSAAHSSIKFTPEILLKISAFITYAPRLKDDIILVQAADWLLNTAPPYLPQSIALQSTPVKFV